MRKFPATPYLLNGLRTTGLLILLGTSLPGTAQVLLDERLLWDQRLFEMESAKDWDRPLQLMVFGGLRYDDNLFRLSDSADAQAVLGSSEEADYIYQIGAAARFATEVSRQKFLLEGNVVQNWYQNYSTLDNASNALRGEWGWQVGNDWNGTLGATHRQYMESFTNIQQNIQDLISRDRLYGSANYRPVSYLRFTIDADWQKTDHDAEARQSLDYTADSTAFTVSWVTPAENTMGVRYRHTNADYDNLGFSTAGLVDNDFKEDEYSLVSTWRASAASQFRGRLGQTRREFDQAPERNFRGPTWRLGYEWEPTGKTALELAVWRELFGFEDLTGNYVRTTGIGIFPAWSVLPKLVLQGKALYQTRDYLGDQAVVTASGQREDQERLLQVAAVWTPLRMTKLILALETGDRDSNQALADYKYNSVGISVLRTF